MQRTMSYMLHPVEVVQARRRAIRRAVALDCELVSSYWDEPIAHRVTDLSPYGMWIETPLPLDPGEELLVSFYPPRWPSFDPVVAIGEVRRVELRRRSSDPRESGMGIQIHCFDPIDHEELAESLRGVPPPLPRQKSPTRARRELLWIDTLLTWEEDLGDRTNIWEVSDLVGMLDEHDLAPHALADLLTGTRSPLPTPRNTERIQPTRSNTLPDRVRASV